MRAAGVVWALGMAAETKRSIQRVAMAGSCMCDTVLPTRTVTKDFVIAPMTRLAVAYK